MAKLKRYEIDAIMSKVRASLSEKLDKQEQEWADEFKKKDLDYRLLEQLAKNAKEAIDALEAQRKRLGFGNSCWGKADLISTPESYVKRNYSKLHSVPNYHEIENDLIISAIDTDFNVDSFIEKVLNKY